MPELHLITGGSGFLGHLIAKSLIERGHRVRVLDIWDAPERDSEIEFVNASVLDRDAVAKAMRGVSVVHNNAALVPISWSKEKIFFSVNRDGAKLVADEAIKAGVDAHVFISSSSIYGFYEEMITDESELRPAGSYAKSKLAGERAVAAVCEDAGMPMISIRPRTIIAPGRLGIFQILFKWILENRNIYLVGSGDHKFQFLHADDMIDFYMLTLEKQLPGYYNVGASEYGTLREDLGALIAAAGSESKFVSLPKAPVIAISAVLSVLRLSPLTASWHIKGYANPFHFDVQPLLDIGWKPRYSNQKMLVESYEWFKENYERLKQEKNSSASPHRSFVQEKILSLLRRLS